MRLGIRARSQCRPEHKRVIFDNADPGEILIFRQALRPEMTSLFASTPRFYRNQIHPRMQTDKMSKAKFYGDNNLLNPGFVPWQSVELPS